MKLYEKAGGINETEQEQIVQAPRGQAFTIMSPTSRSTFRVDTAPGITEMFEERDYQSRYFTGEGGEENWESFVGESRNVREESELSSRDERPESFSEAPSNASDEVSLRIFDDDEEYETFARSERGSGVSFSIQEEKTSIEEAPRNQRTDLGETETFSSAAVDGNSQAIFNMIASALGRMADAAERGGGASSSMPFAGVETIVAKDSDETTGEDLKELNERLRRAQAEKDEEIRRLMEENELLRSGSGLYSGVQEPEEPAVEPYDGLIDDAYGEEEDGDLVRLVELEAELADIDLNLQDPDYYNENSGENEEPDYDQEEFYPSENEEYGSDGAEDPYEEADDDFMSAFCSFAEELKNMTVSKRMRANGKDVCVISLAELAAEAAAQHASGR